MNHRRILWLVLFGGLMLALALMLVLESTGWASSPRSSRASAGPVEMPVALDLSLALATSPSSMAETELFPNCRYGVAAWSGQVQQFDIVSNLGMGWYLDFATHQTPSGPAEAEFVQVIRLDQGRESRGGSDVCGPTYPFTITPSLTEGGLGAIVANNPGALWIVGNEPDRILAQDDICPQQYTEAYHDVYHFIKDRDPAAQVAVAGLVEVTPGRLQYLDIVWDTYLAKYGTSMPVDVWNMHIYMLPEGPGEMGAAVALGTDPAIARPLCGHQQAGQSCYRYADHDDLDLFKEQVVWMRDWMKRRGQQNKPLILTEYSILYPFEDYDDEANPTVCYLQDEEGKCFTAARVAHFMTQTLAYLESATDPELGCPVDGHRLVQQWLWFSLAFDGPGYVSDLMTPDTYTLTQQGYTWQDHVAAIPAVVNLFPVRVPVVRGHASNGTDPVTVTLAAEVMNNGNIALTETVTVTFYSDQGLTAPIGSATFAGLGGCARREAIVTTTWEGLATGVHHFWVEVDSAEMITETSETDNVIQGMVIANPFDVFLPLVLRSR